jgi:hypothetical protein
MGIAWDSRVVILRCSEGSRIERREVSFCRDGLDPPPRKLAEAIALSRGESDVGTSGVEALPPNLTSAPAAESLLTDFPESVTPSQSPDLIDGMSKLPPIEVSRAGDVGA